MTIEQKFWLRVRKTDGCWLWTGHLRGSGGYGDFAIVGAPDRYAHRASWIIHFGQIPEGMKVLHKCDNPPCVRPDHLFLGNDLANMRDRDQKQRSGFHRGLIQKLNWEQVIEIRKLYDSGRYSQQALGEMFEISQRQISNVVRCQHWQHLWGR